MGDLNSRDVRGCYVHRTLGNCLDQLGLDKTREGGRERENE